MKKDTNKGVVAEYTISYLHPYIFLDNYTITLSYGYTDK